MALSLNRLLISALPVALFGCGVAGDSIVPASSPAPEPQGFEQVQMPDPESPDPDARVTEEKPHFSFNYGWPDLVEAQPALAAALRTRANEWLTEMRGFAAEDERLADPAEEFKPEYMSDTRWQVAGESGPLISLSSTFYHYTGGAHGIYGVDALLFDRQGGDAIEPKDIFIDKEAARNAVQDVYCDLLDLERERRRGSDYPRTSDDSFWECIDPIAQTLIFHAGKGGEAFDRLIVYAGPYAAGPYAESDYVIELPVTAALIAAIRPEYRDLFAVSDEPALVEQPGL